MDNEDDEGTYRDWHLWWGGAWKARADAKCTPEEESKENCARSKLPLFPSYYSYLLKLAPGVGLVDIYPWLAELIFFSVGVDVDADSPTQNENLTPLNMVSIFVDDSRDNVALSRLSSDRRKKNPIKELLTQEGASQSKECQMRLFMLDTFGQFKDAPLDQDEIRWHEKSYAVSSLVGGGNPMQMMRRFSAIGDLPLEGKRKVFPDDILGNLNCFVINSISNLYRSMGVRDAMLLVRAMMEQGVWKSKREEPDDKKKKLIDNRGMVFAVLHDGVFPKADTMYIETFFDGVIVFERKKGSEITFRFGRFPPSAPGRDKHRKGYPFQPAFSDRWTFKAEENGRLKIELVNSPPPKNEEVLPLDKALPAGKIVHDIGR